MSKQVSIVMFALLAVLAGCSQLSSSNRDGEGVQARFVAASALLGGAAAGVQGDVLTSVRLQHLTVGEAETELRKGLAEGVRVAHVGQAKSVLIQGPAQGVVAALKVLKTLDVQ